MGAEPQLTAKPPLARSNDLWALGLYCLFFFSGISGLIYEVAWTRMLGHILGNTVYATSTILAAFMAGLAVGGFLIGRFIDRVKSPLLVYAFLETGIGISAWATLCLSTWPMPLYRAIYHAAGESRGWLTVGQVIIATLVLFVPTMLMGSTLPTLSVAGMLAHRRLGRHVGILYALNTLGAALGVILSGFILLGAIGETRTVLVGVLINILVTLGALLMHFRAQRPQAAPADSATVSTPAPPSPAASTAAVSAHAAKRGRVAVLVVFALAGFVALASEVIWSRLLVICLGTSIYAFSAVLLVMLTFMGVGSLAGGYLADRIRNPLRTLARLELIIGAASILGLYLFRYPGGTDSTQDLIWSQPNVWPVIWPIVLLLIMIAPAGFCAGLAFPVAARYYARNPAMAGRGVGELYGWNTLGCIIGSLAAGFLIIPLVGISHSAALMAAVSCALAVVLILANPQGFKPLACVPELLILIIVAVAIGRVGDPFYDYLIQSAQETLQVPSIQVYKNVEDAVATTTAFTSSSRGKELWINGVGVTNLWSGCKLMAHLPLALTVQPRDALVVCLGMGTAFRSVTRHRDINVTAVELDPAVARFFPYYHSDAARVLAQPNVKIVIDDGRNYLAMHDQKYDLITIDPAPPIYSAGTVNLYCREFCELCRDHLRPTGCVCLWVPPAASDDVAMILKTFVQTFPHVLMFRGPGIAGFYCIGSLDKKVNVSQRVMAGLSDPIVQRDLSEWDHLCDDPRQIMGLFVCDETFLRQILAQAPSIDDDHPYTEFPLWREMLVAQRWDNLFTVADFQRIQAQTYAQDSVRFEQEGDLTAALDLRRRSMAIEPADAGMHLSTAHLAITLGNPGIAVDELNKALQADPGQRGNVARGLLGVANIELAQGHRDAALRELHLAQHLGFTSQSVADEIARLQGGGLPAPAQPPQTSR